MYIDRCVEISAGIKNYKKYDVYYQDQMSGRLVLYKPRNVDIEEVRLTAGKIPTSLYVSINDQLDFVSSRHKEYNKRLKNILRTNPRKSKRLLAEVLELGVTVPVGEIAHRMRETVDIVLKEYMSDEDIVKRMIEVTLKDTSTSVHSVNVMLHCLGFARQSEYEYHDLKSFGLMGLFHDVGKLRIPDSVLKAPRRLTEEEFEIIKAHPSHGYDILVKSRLEKRIRMGALQHHERLDGSGYPKNLEGKDVLPESKALAIIDVYEALTNWRPYKGPVNSIKALEIIKEEVEAGKLDREMFQIFARSLVGTKI